MIVAIADTHAAIWYAYDDPKLAVAAVELFEQAIRFNDQIGIATISFVEITFLIEKGRIPSAARFRLESILDRPDIELITVPLTREITSALSMVPRGLVPDMPDRIIAASALHLGLPLLSRDRRIRSSGVTTVW